MNVEQVMMRQENPSWILVEGSSAEAIQHAILEHAEVCTPQQPSRHRVSIFLLDDSRWAIAFDPPLPPYEFTNLIGWLDDPEMTRDAQGAVGWLCAPGSGMRYFLAPQRENASGDTLVGIDSDGVRVSVYLPECSVAQTAEPVAPVPEPELPLQRMQAVAVFETTADSDPSFGNPEFVVE
jgi:hypothetical protein